MQRVRKSLEKSYLILCLVLKDFNNLSEIRFYTLYYSLLIKYFGKNLAEIILILLTNLKYIKSGIEITIDRVNKSNTDFGDI